MTEYFITYDIATGEERWKGSGPDGIADIQNLPSGIGLVTVSEAEFVLPLADIPLDTLQESVRERVNKFRDKLIASGYIVPSGSLAGERLQLRTDSDKINWLTSRDLYATQVATGNGSSSGAKFRTAENETITLTFTEGLSVLTGLAVWAASVMNHSWDLKDAVTAATDVSTVLTLDITEGWPA